MVDYLLDIQDIQKTKRGRSQSTVQRSLMYDNKYGLSRINKHYNQNHHHLQIKWIIIIQINNRWYLEY